MQLEERRIGYPRRPLPDDVRAPWEPGDLFALTDTARRFHASRALLKAMLGGFGSAKTTTLCAEAIFAGFENLGHSGVLFEPTFPLVRDALRPSMDERLTEFGLRRGTDWTYSITDSTWRVLGGAERGGFSILGRAASEWERIVGMNLAWAGLDEPARMPREALTAARARVRVGPVRRVFLTGTPDPGSWVSKWAQRPPSGAAIFHAATTENPYIAQDYLDMLAQEYDAKALDAYLRGQIVSLTGGAYHAFSNDPWPAGNVGACAYDASLPLYVACDNNRDPLVAVLAHRVGNVLRVFSEVFLRGGSWSALSEAIHARCGGVAPAGIILHGDAVLRGAIDNEMTDWGAFASIRDHLRRVFGKDVRIAMRAPKANPLELNRLETANAHLCTSRGERRVMVDPRCVELLADMREMETDEEGRLRKPGRAKGVDRDRSHLSDALGYLLHAEWPAGASTASRRVAIVSVPLPSR